jgi:hypothetical protein
MSGLTMYEFLDHLDREGTPCGLEAFYPRKVVEAKAEKAFRKGYADWGVSYRSAWLTDKGREFLA